MMLGRGICHTFHNIVCTDIPQNSGSFIYKATRVQEAELSCGEKATKCARSLRVIKDIVVTTPVVDLAYLRQRVEGACETATRDMLQTPDEKSNIIRISFEPQGVHIKDSIADFLYFQKPYCVNCGGIHLVPNSVQYSWKRRDFKRKIKDKLAFPEALQEKPETIKCMEVSMLNSPQIQLVTQVSKSYLISKKKLILKNLEEIQFKFLGIKVWMSPTFRIYVFLIIR
ncbi:hypothetical protein C0J52_15715 [Blattella germanica]|nr:hypothetical protein C0J52_15715 [Blattella germanica]